MIPIALDTSPPPKVRAFRGHPVTIQRMDTQFLGRALMVLGLVILAAGVAVYFGGKAGFFGLGKLPGDIRVERESFSFYFPVTTSIVISIVLTLLFALFSKWR